jgi:hypothetical protein
VNLSHHLFENQTHKVFLVPCPQALVEEVAGLRSQVAHLNSLLQTVVASQPPSPTRSFSPGPDTY